MFLIIIHDIVNIHNVPAYSFHQMCQIKTVFFSNMTHLNIYMLNHIGVFKTSQFLQQYLY